MRKAIEKCHFFHLGIGGSRKKNIGFGCNCPVNIIHLTMYEHDCLDGRTTNYQVEHAKHIYKKELESVYPAHRHKWAFAKVFGYMKKFEKALEHHQSRNKGLTLCSKK